jgi:hypothetical protein
LTADAARVPSPGANLVVLTGSAATDTVRGAESLADAVERLFAEFEPKLPMAFVLATVRRCRRELDIISGPALPELVERLARQRLLDFLGRARARHG